MKVKSLSAILLMMLALTVVSPSPASANLTGCPSTWPLKVEARPGNTPVVIRDEDPELLSTPVHSTFAFIRRMEDEIEN